MLSYYYQARVRKWCPAATVSEQCDIKLNIYLQFTQKYNSMNNYVG